MYSEFFFLKRVRLDLKFPSFDLEGVQFNFKDDQCEMKVVYWTS